MPEPLSLAVGVYCLGYSALAAYSRVGSAISSESAAARRSAFAVVESGERSYALFGGKAGAISELQALANECADAGWDGEAAAGMNSLAVSTAQDFVRALPEGLPLPEFAPEPDGSVSLDWTASQHRRLTLSIGNSNRLAYAWLDGADKGHGVARFDGSNVPPRVLEGIQSILSHARTSFRAS